MGEVHQHPPITSKQGSTQPSSNIANEDDSNTSQPSSNTANEDASSASSANGNGTSGGDGVSEGQPSGNGEPSTNFNRAGKAHSHLLIFPMKLILTHLNHLLVLPMKMLPAHHPPIGIGRVVEMAYQGAAKQQ